MGQADRPRGIPGLSVLGGAAAGFSFEGLLRDAIAQEGQPLRPAPVQRPETLRQPHASGSEAERASALG
jgi:hypothetical protein